MLWKVAFWLLQKTIRLPAAMNAKFTWKLCISYHSNQDCKMKVQNCASHYAYLSMRSVSWSDCLWRAVKVLNCSSNLALTAVTHISAALKDFVLVLECFDLSIQEKLLVFNLKTFKATTHRATCELMIHETKWTEDWTFQNNKQTGKEKRKYKLIISLCPKKMLTKSDLWRLRKQNLVHWDANSQRNVFFFSLSVSTVKSAVQWKQWGTILTVPHLQYLFSYPEFHFRSQGHFSIPTTATINTLL